MTKVDSEYHIEVKVVSKEPGWANFGIAEWDPQLFIKVEPIYIKFIGNSIYLD